MDRFVDAASDYFLSHVKKTEKKKEEKNSEYRLGKYLSRMPNESNDFIVKKILD